MFSRGVFSSVLALSESSAASGASEVPVAAAVAIGDEIIHISTNMVEMHRNPLYHAEFICIEKSIKTLGWKYLDEASLYVTLEPCSFCASALDKVRINDIFFGAYDTRCGAIFHGSRIFDHSIHKPNIIGGIEEKRCSNVLSNFFKNLRNKSLSI